MIDTFIKFSAAIGSLRANRLAKHKVKRRKRLDRDYENTTYTKLPDVNNIYQ